jgi:cytochrome c oxidase cbb3-type subunit IV
MIRDVVSFLDYSICAEISLGLFVSVFVAVTLRTLLLSRRNTTAMAAIPLEEGHKEPVQ